MLKKLFSYFIIVILLLNNISITYAEEATTDEVPVVTQPGNNSNSSDKNSDLTTEKDKEISSDESEKEDTSTETTPETGDGEDTGTETAPETGDEEDTGTETTPETGDEEDTGTETPPETGDGEDTGTETAPETGDEEDTGTETTPETGDEEGTDTETTLPEGDTVTGEEGDILPEGEIEGDVPPKTAGNIITDINVNVGETDLSLKWEKVDGAEGYEIEIDGIIYAIKENNFHITDIIGTVSHTIKIRAVSSTLDFEWSETINFGFPEVPQNLHHEVEGNTVTLKWDKGINDKEYYVQINGKIMNIEKNEYSFEAEDDMFYFVRVKAQSYILEGKWTDIYDVIISDIVQNGSTQNPYIINNIQALECMQYKLDAHYVLGKDIDAQNQQIGAVGSLLHPFEGSLDGKGFKLSNLNIVDSGEDLSDKRVGLFGRTTDATVKNLILENSKATGEEDLGLLIGSAVDTCIKNITIQGSTIIEGEDCVGIIGFADDSNISNITINDSIKITGSDNVGALVGKVLGGSIKQIGLNATSTVSGDDDIGSIIGEALDCNISEVSVEQGSVSGEDLIGGIIGHATNTDLYKSYSKADVHARDKQAGGLIGKGNEVSIQQCYATGDISAEVLGYVGGLVGEINLDSSIANSFSACTVTGDSKVGGIVGYVGKVLGNKDITNCYSISKISGDDDVSAIVEQDWLETITMTNCYYDGVASGYAPRHENDESRLTTAMKRQDTYKGWDFENIWTIDEGYPYLRNVAKPSVVYEGLPKDDMAYGQGTEDDPYVIETYNHLNNIRYDIKAHYKLGNNIDCNDKDFKAIASKSMPFEGKFDGDSHKIMNINISGEDNVGFFSRLKDATIKNTIFTDINVNGEENVGVVVGKALDSIIQDIKIDGDSSVTGSIDVGGIAGDSEYVSVKRSSSNVTVSASQRNAGGILGKGEDVTIEECNQIGDVSADILNIGGIVGNLEGTSTISDCYYKGDLEGGMYVGGIVGDADGIGSERLIKNCYSVATFEGVNKRGIYKFSLLTDIENCYFDKDVSGIKSPLSQARNTSDMSLEDNYEDWDFSSKWFFQDGETYPKLINQIVPKNMKQTNITTKLISLEWDDIPADISYELLINDDKVVPVSTNQYTHIGLDAGTVYRYRLRVVTNTGFKCPWSKEYSFLTLSAPPKDVTYKSDSDSITLNWPNVKGAKSYQIEVMGEELDLNSAKYVSKNLSNNTQYSYRLRSINKTGIGPWSDPIVCRTMPEDINSINASSTDETITFTWEAVPGVDSYELEVNGNIVEVTETTYTKTGLKSNTIYKYRIRGKNDIGVTDWSDKQQIYTKLGRPINVSVNSELIENVISNTVTWDKVSGAVKYELLIDGSPVLVDTNEYKHENVGFNQNHVYKVRAIGSDSTSKWSDDVQKGTQTATPVIKNVDIQSSMITVIWDHVDGAETYEIEINGQSKDIKFTNSYTITNLTEEEYDVRIRTKNAAGYSEWSKSTKAVCLLTEPQNITASKSCASITVSWDMVGGADGYEIIADGETVSIKGKTNTSYRHKDLSPYTTHVYRVRAINSKNNNQSDWSKSIIAKTLVDIPDDLEAEEVTSTKIDLDWDHVSGATGYQLRLDSKLVNVDGTSYVHRELKPNSTHEYRVRAYNDDGFGRWSKTLIQMTSPEEPTNLRTESGIDSILVKWDRPEGAVRFELMVDGKVVKVKGTEYNHTNLESNSKHTYKVRAINKGDATSSYTRLLKAQTQPKISVPVKKDNMFNFVIVAPVKKYQKVRYIDFYYKEEQIEILDLCAITPEINNELGKIKDTNITVVEFKDGHVRLKVTDVTKTFINTLQLRVKSNEQPEVHYHID